MTAFLTNRVFIAVATSVATTVGVTLSTAYPSIHSALCVI